MRNLTWQGDGVVGKPEIPSMVGKFYPIIFLFQLEYPSTRDVLGHGPRQGQELGCLGVPFSGGRGISVTHDGQDQGTLQQP